MDKSRPIAHVCICVEDMEKSIAFYKEAFGYEVINRLETPGFKLTWVGHRGEGVPNFVELRTDNGHTGPYDRGYASNHFAVLVEDVKALLPKHEAMGIVDQVVPDGPYFVHDIDGYSIEVMDDRVVMNFFG